VLAAEVGAGELPQRASSTAEGESAVAPSMIGDPSASRPVSP
jgi:hypothetical protein